MINIKQNKDIKDTMDVSIVGNAEDVACEYAALTLKLMHQYGPVFDRAMDYVNKIMKEELEL
jgi:hypothetical protein